MLCRVRQCGFDHKVNGCAPQGNVRPVHEPRGRQVSNRRGMTTAEGIRISGTLPVLLLTVKTGCNRHRRQFLWFCKVNGLRWRIPQQNTVPVAERWHDAETGEVLADAPQELGREFTTVVEVTGGPALEKLVSLDCIARQDETVYPMNVRPPRFNSSTYRR